MAVELTWALGERLALRPSVRQCIAAGSSFSAGDFIRRASAAEQEWPFERVSLRLALQDVRTRQAAPLLIISVCSHSLLLYQRSTLERISGSMVGAGKQSATCGQVRIMNEGVRLADVLEKSRFAGSVYEFVSSTGDLHEAMQMARSMSESPTLPTCYLRFAVSYFGFHSLDT